MKKPIIFFFFILLLSIWSASASSSNLRTNYFLSNLQLLQNQSTDKDEAIPLNKNKVSQLSDEYVDTFNDFKVDRYTIDESDGSYSSWERNVDSGLLKINKDENETAYTDTVTLTDPYDVTLVANTTSSFNNSYAPSGAITSTDSISSVGSGNLVTVTSTATISSYAYANSNNVRFSLEEDATNNLLYEGRQVGGYLHIWNVSDPSTPSKVFDSNTYYTQDIHLNVSSKRLFGAYTGGTSGSFGIYNLTDPINPTVIDTASQSYGGFYDYYSAMDVNDANTKAYVAWGDSTGANTVIYEVDLSDETSISFSATTWDHSDYGPYVSEIEYLTNDIYAILVMNTGSSEANIVLADFSDFSSVNVLDNITLEFSGVEAWWKAEIDQPDSDHIILTAGSRVHYIDISNTSAITNSSITSPQGVSYVSSLTEFYSVGTAGYSDRDEIMIYYHNPNNGTLLNYATITNINYYAQGPTAFIGNFLYHSYYYGSAPTFRYRLTVSNISTIVNATTTYYNGGYRAFPSFNLTDTLALPLASSTFKQVMLDVTSFTTTNLSSSDTLRVFLYNLTDSSIITNTSQSWTDAQLQTFWNTTSQYISSLTFTKAQLDSLTSLDITTLAQYWLSNKTAGNTLLGLGLEIVGASYSDLKLLSYTGTLSLDITFDVDTTDEAYYAISAEIEPAPALIAQLDFVVNTTATTGTGNTLEFQLAIQTTNGTVLNTNHYFRAVVLDPSLAVYLQWSTATSTINASTGITLSMDKQYKFTFDYSTTDSKLSFSILSNSGSQILRAVDWRNYVSDESANRPSIFSVEPLTENWRSDDTPAHKKGILATINCTSASVVTGESNYYFDRLYLSKGLLDTGFYCDPDGLSPYTNCSYSATGASDYVHSNVYGVDFEGLDGNKSYAEYTYTVRNFISFTGKQFFSFDGILDGSTDNNRLYSAFNLYVDAYPIPDAGISGAIELEEKVSLSLTILRTGSDHFMYAYIRNNVTFQYEFGTTGILDAPPIAELGFGIYWAKPGTLALAIQVYNQSNDELVIIPTYSEHDPDLYSQDVRFQIWYEINGSTPLNGRGGLSETTLQTGEVQSFQQPAIPVPQELFKRSGGFDLFGIFKPITDPIGGFFGQLLSGDIWGALGGAFAALINPITDILDAVSDGFSQLGDALQSVIDGILDLANTIWSAFWNTIIPFFQDLADDVFGWILDTFVLRDAHTMLGTIFEFAIDMSFYIFIIVVFACFSLAFFLSYNDGEFNIGQILYYTVKIWFTDLLNGAIPFIRLPLILVCIVWSVLLGYNDILFGWIPL